MTRTPRLMVALDPPLQPVMYQFGPYRLSVADRELVRDGVPVPLFPKAFDILVVLLENQDRIVTKEELLLRVWPDTFVQESNLTQNIHLLRKALGSGGNDQTFIQTIPRRGYRFRATTPIAGDVAEVVLTHRETTHIVVEETTEEPPAHTRGSLLRITAAFGAAALLIGVVVLLSRMHVWPDAAKPTREPSAPRLERLTTDSRSYEPAISPDGRFVAYRVADAERQTVWLRNIATGSAVQILPPVAAGYYSLKFSSDGNEILYKTFRNRSDNGTVFRVPLFGGAPQLVAANVWSDFGLSPDGKNIAFVRANASYQHQLIVASAGGGQERVVATMGDQQRWLDVDNTSPSWSPDGARLVFCGGSRDTGRRWTFGIFEVPAQGGEMKRVASPAWNRISHAAWLHDGSGIVVVGRSKQRDPYQVWLVDYPSGETRRLTNDLNDYNKLHVSADSKVIAIEQQLAFHELWTMSIDGAQPPRQISYGARSEDGYFGLSWTPDGRLLFASSRTGESEIFTSNPDGSDLRQLTRDSTEWNTNARMTADGRFIVFSSGRNGEANIWRMDWDGSNVVQLTRGKSEFSPAVTPDGRWVYYVNAHVSPSRIERVSIDGGAPEVIFDDAAAEIPMISPDGKWLAFSMYDERTGWRTAVMPAAGGAPRVLAMHGVRGLLRWTADSRGLMFIKREGNVSNVWLQPLDGSEPRAVTAFREQFLWNFAPSPDGKQLALSRGTAVSDIVLLRDFR